MIFFLEEKVGNLMTNPLKLNPTIKWEVLKVSVQLLINQTLTHMLCNLFLYIIAVKV